MRIVTHHKNTMATWKDMDSSDLEGEEANIDFMKNVNSDTSDNSDDEEVDFFDIDYDRQAYYESISHNGKLIEMYKTLKRNTKEICKELEDKLRIANEENEKLKVENSILSNDKLELEMKLVEINTIHKELKKKLFLTQKIKVNNP